MRYSNPHRRNAARFDRRRYDPRTRAGLVMAPGMDYAGLGDAESLFMEEGVALAPMSCSEGRGGPHAALTILPTATVQDVQDGALAGLVVPGGHGGDDNAAAATFDKLVNAAHAEDLPVMAFGDAVPRALESLGFEPPADAPPAILLHDGVRILESADDVRDAIAAFHAPTRAAA